MLYVDTHRARVNRRRVAALRTTFQSLLLLSSLYRRIVQVVFLYQYPDVPLNWVQIWIVGRSHAGIYKSGRFKQTVLSKNVGLHCRHGSYAETMELWLFHFRHIVYTNVSL